MHKNNLGSLFKFKVYYPESQSHNSGSSGQGKAWGFAFQTSTSRDSDAEVVQITYGNHTALLFSGCVTEQIPRPIHLTCEV